VPGMWILPGRPQGAAMPGMRNAFRPRRFFDLAYRDNKNLAATYHLGAACSPHRNIPSGHRRPRRWSGTDVSSHCTDSATGMGIGRECCRMASVAAVISGFPPGRAKTTCHVHRWDCGRRIALCLGSLRRFGQRVILHRVLLSIFDGVRTSRNIHRISCLVPYHQKLN
jgi:hypothetical protein